jgi:GH25 family lysozyme M1 (1,4-beta-N-acetylmuramidase)
MKKRLALLLAAALLAQLLTVATFAEDTYVEVPQQPTEVTLEETEEPQPTEATEEEAAPEVTEAAPAEPVAEPAEEPAYEEAAPQVTEEVPAEDPAYEAESDAIEAEQYASNLASSYGDCYTRTLSSGETLRKGIDVSAYQGNINWKAVAASGIEFAIIRVGYRGYGVAGTLCNDSYFKANIEGALAAGLKVGVYIFSQAITMQEGIQEAQFVLDRIRGYDISLPLFIDYEYAGTGLGRLYNAHLSKAVATDICNAFVYTVQKAGYTGAVYAGRNFVWEQLNSSDISCLWLAHYVYAGNTTNYGGDYDFWQFSSTGTVSGISGNVDLDFWFDDGSFRKLNGWMSFLDVDRDRWSYSHIRYIYEAGIVNGIDEYTYSPSGKTTRGQLATMLYRMAGSPTVTGSSGFTDLTQNYYKNAVTWAKQQGIINGTSATTFEPDGYVTRQDLVTMLYRMAGSPQAVGSLSGFTDAAEVRDYAVDAVTWAVAEGILQGDGSKIDPKGSATREQVAAFLSRYMQR